MERETYVLTCAVATVWGPGALQDQLNRFVAAIEADALVLVGAVNVVMLHPDLFSAIATVRKGPIPPNGPGGPKTYHTLLPRP